MCLLPCVCTVPGLKPVMVLGPLGISLTQITILLCVSVSAPCWQPKWRVGTNRWSKLPDQIEVVAPVGAWLVSADGEPSSRGSGPGEVLCLGASGWCMLEVRLPLQEGAALVGPGPYLPALGRRLRHPKASQKAVRTYVQVCTHLLGLQVGFLGNLRATSTWALLYTKFPTGHVDRELESQCQSALRGVKMPFRRVTSWDAGPEAAGRVQYQRQCQPL